MQFFAPTVTEYEKVVVAQWGISIFEKYNGPQLCRQQCTPTYSKLYSEGENDRKKLNKKGEKTDRMVYMNPTKGGLEMFWKRQSSP